jgi:hypothetical protein
MISEETRAKMSEAHKGKYHTDESKIKMSVNRKAVGNNWKIGTHVSEDTKKKISASLRARGDMGDHLRGKPRSEETRGKISKTHQAIGSPWNIGTHPSEDTKKKIGDANRHPRKPLTDDHGYMRVYSPGHPRTRKGQPYVLEHILVWERERGAIPNKFHIHHLNGIKSDNRIENLVCISPSVHESNHMTEKHKLREALRARIRELEDRIRELEGGA